MPTADTHTAQKSPAPLSCGLGANPATPYQVGFEDRRYRREYACPWRAGTLAAREYDAGVMDAHAAERAEVL